MMHKCIYCCGWNYSHIIKKETENKTRNVTRRCPINKTNIDSQSKGCKYFDPSGIFYCNKNFHFVAFLACLNRRHNPHNINKFDECKKCKQFDNEIKPIVIDYWIDRIPIIKPVKKRILKRRGKTNQTAKPVTKRILKRRKI